MQLRKPTLQITYDGKDISEEIGKYMLSFTYTDHVSGKSDELEIEVEDSRDLWKGSWYPDKGATLTAKFGFIGRVVSAGKFQIDEAELTGPPDIVRIRSLATGVKNAVRTKNSYAHEDKTLRQIAQVIADKHGMAIQGDIPEIRIGRVTQNRETDLAFLKRVSEDYGLVFSIRDKVITFTNVYDLEGAEPVTEIDRADIGTFSFTDKIVDTYKGAHAKHHKPMTKTSVSAYSELGVSASGAGATSADTLEIRELAEDELQAESKAKSKLHKKNKLGVTARLTMSGNPYLLAGNNFTLTGFFKLNGVWHIEESKHMINQSGGYATEITCRRVKKPT